jgi:hypothetical protein
MHRWHLYGLLARLHWAAAVRATQLRLLSHLCYSMHLLQYLPCQQCMHNRNWKLQLPTIDLSDLQLHLCTMGTLHWHLLRHIFEFKLPEQTLLNN